MSDLVENYGQSWLQQSQYPDLHDPHRCGTAPFVPRVDAPRQHSCGSYEAGFGPDGCNKYQPNYPDDYYLRMHGCKGLADCKNGVPPTGHIALEGTRVTQPGHCGEPNAGWWPVVGYDVDSKAGPACKEGFIGSLVGNDTIANMLWLALIFLVIKKLVRK